MSSEVTRERSHASILPYVGPRWRARPGRTAPRRPEVGVRKRSCGRFGVVLPARRSRDRDSWSKAELGALKRAVTLHGRDWAAVASSLGSKTRQQCKSKVASEVVAGRMQEPGGKWVLDS